MGKKRNTVKDKSFSEVIGFKRIFHNDIINFIVGIILIVLSIFVFISFISFFSAGQDDQSLVLDLRPSEIFNSGKVFQNSCGSFGAFVSYFFISRCFGLPALLIPVFVCMVGLKLVKAYEFNLIKYFFCFAITLIWCSITFAEALAPVFSGQIFNPGGDHGAYCSQWIENVVGTPGLILVLVLSALIFLTYLSKETMNVVRKMLNPAKMVSQKIPFNISAGNTKTSADAQVYDDPETQKVDWSVVGNPKQPETTPDVIVSQQPDDNGNAKEGGNPDIIINKPEPEEPANTSVVSGTPDLNTPINPKEPWTKYKYPTLDLLANDENGGKPYIDMKEQNANKNRIVEVLGNFGVQIKTISATVGPTITLYEITPDEGVRISKIRNLEDDIALSLAALGIRIIAPIPGKGTIGIEVPNAKRNNVSMMSVLNSKRFQETTMDLPIAIGKTITNEVFMADLAKIPHLLVAGATGQGKSVGLNAIITSLLYKKHPNELKFVLIDPKKVEFSVYEPITNHFMAKLPDDSDEAIITDVTKVIRTLNSLCKLMDTRYDLLKAAGARNIKEYNKKYLNHQLKLTDGHEYMPYIVVVIDEFGDLIMTAGKEIETPIARIAQLARAVGIHMVIATQRPTTSIITGNIKANFPGRMAFKVSAMIDSRTILDRPGANQLIGMGDMLFLNGNEPVRVQCAFIDTPEIININKYIQNQPGPLEPMELPEPSTEDGGESASGLDVINKMDPLFEETARSIVATQLGSTSMIQRRFNIGYNRAGRIMDQMEKAGIVGKTNGSKPREVLIQDESSLESLLSRIKNKQ